MDQRWLDLLTQKMGNLSLNSGRRIKVRKVEKYGQLVKRFKINDKSADDFTPEESATENEIIHQNLYTLEHLPLSQEGMDEFILFNYTKALQMQKNCALDENHETYKDYPKVMKIKIRIIREKINTNVQCLNNSSVPLDRKLYYIKKLNKALLNLYVDEEKRLSEQSVEQITRKIKVLKIKTI